MPQAALSPAPAGHDHRHCIDAALARAEELCAARGARLTDLRRRVLELVWSSHRPRGAYSILEDLSRNGRVAAPLTVYRALDFLVAHGLVHRIESLNAYIGCDHPENSHDSQFLVCDGCGNTTELTDARVAAAIAASAGDLGFRVAHPTVEVRGLCPDCQTEEPSS
ncbi:MAG TPA: Fur family transcriptional regulator [Azospirillaceae bacterium]|nr:Fur family transcriptional regulator [Azospirillaceae bacterium]